MTTGRESTGGSAELKAATAKLETGPAGSECVVKVGGDWRLSERVPGWTGVVGKSLPASTRVVPDDLGKWDTSLVLFLAHGRTWCAESKKEFHPEALPDNLQTLLRQVPGPGAPKPLVESPLKSGRALTGSLAKIWTSHIKEIVSFVGECTLGFISSARKPRRFRWLDCLVEMQQCWASSLPIVSLVSFLARQGLRPARLGSP